MHTICLSAFARAFVGLAVSVFLGHWVTGPFVRCLWRKVRREYGGPLEPKLTFSSLLGCLERGLYTGALLLGAPQWIGVWLAIKVAAKWRSRNETAGDDAPSAPVDNIWLIGTGLSLLFGFLGAAIAHWPLPVLGR